ncbi:hypothetical protein L228DRAFT_242972 [Xylona heveae TC161]|uniref:N-acetyltransferase domain-containing protein n=1 Tax=Xylona heveae (strain CBS 132557 / TC161) TaxID=1328760 RepID=A0A165JPW0_XYLHT|nr:hypothetical protein L228DRAFT_242972 [Xylona heveae TC161]KZF26496.1 hypothetical protein L228DRAFT_242972 [Xylona heveae TC161]
MPAARRLGVGLKLIQAAQHAALRQAKDMRKITAKITVMVYSQNKPARLLYEKSGFKISETNAHSRNETLSDGKAVLTMEWLGLAAETTPADLGEFPQ